MVEINDFAFLIRMHRRMKITTLILRNAEGDIRYVLSNADRNRFLSYFVFFLKHPKHSVILLFLYLVPFVFILKLEKIAFLK